ncbi:zinc finger, RING-type domain-containing protein [Endozoicomonas sp. 4G]|uniref:RING finger protein n=1 Tax=Endozoicomonas sp. 4G TaxID=2872754 RepID=UPI002078681C|nr:zinc finger, RING-type domain-containing protein [Endozoicomonas sp. 4G]
MKRFLRYLLFFLPFMASVAAQVPGGLTAYRLPDQASALTNATDDLEPPAKKQKRQQTSSESELVEADPQQLLNQYLEGFNVMATPADNFCWLHAIRLSADQDVSTLISTLINMINHHLSGNEQALTAEHSAFLSRWINAQGQENVQLVRRQLINKEWPDFTILLPLLSHLFKKTFVVINLHASGLTQDQVFTYAASNHVQATIVSAASAINTSEETIYLGLLSRDSHFVGIRDTQDDNHSHSCPVCFDEFTKNSPITSTSCFHYLCDDCFEKMKRSPAWDCPVCREQQYYTEPRNQQLPSPHESGNEVVEQNDPPAEQEPPIQDDEEYDFGPFQPLNEISRYCAILRLKARSM